MKENKMLKKDFNMHIYIPQSSTVHRTSGKIFDRNQDGDYEITNESLDDRFYLENDRRIDIRNIIGREICVNLLIHREFIEPFYARLIIEKDVLRTENANKARMIGDILQEKNFSPKPKNPKIAMVFREIGLADELGSGMIKLLKYTKAYSNGIPKLIEGDIFKTEIPLVRIEETTNSTILTTTLTTVLTETQQQIIRLIKENNKITREEIANKIGITKSGVQYNLNILKKNNYIRRVGRTYKGHWEILQ